MTAAPRQAARITLLVACANHGVIGRDNALPWHLPEDLRHFRQTTLGHVLVMGRRTFDSIGRPLPGRHTVVLSRDPSWRHEGCELATSLDRALDRAAAAERGEIFVVGGAEVYREALPRADRVLMTRIALEVAGDAFFPPLPQTQWAIATREDHVAASGTRYAILDWRRRTCARDASDAAGRTSSAG